MNAITIARARVTAINGDELTLQSDDWKHPKYVSRNLLAGFSKEPEIGDIIAVFIGSYTGAIVHAKGMPVDT